MNGAETEWPATSMAEAKLSSTLQNKQVKSRLWLRLRDLKMDEITSPLSENIQCLMQNFLF